MQTSHVDSHPLTQLMHRSGGALVHLPAFVALALPEQLLNLCHLPYRPYQQQLVVHSGHSSVTTLLLEVEGRHDCGLEELDWKLGAL